MTDNVLHVFVINRHGRLVRSEHKKAPIVANLSKNDFDFLFMQRILQTSMMNDSADKLGRVNVIVIEREIYTECIFPFFDGVVLVIFDSTNVTEGAKRISKLITEFNFEISRPTLTL
jgi:hypothetical protein